MTAYARFMLDAHSNLPKEVISIMDQIRSMEETYYKYFEELQAALPKNDELNDQTKRRIKRISTQMENICEKKVSLCDKLYDLVDAHHGVACANLRIMRSTISRLGVDVNKIDEKIQKDRPEVASSSGSVSAEPLYCHCRRVRLFCCSLSM